jgi:hypothetical protein
MPYRLHVTAGPSLDLSTHRPILVNNDEHPLELQSPHFRGRITVRVKDFPGAQPENELSLNSSHYFDKKTATFSLQCQGAPSYMDVALGPLINLGIRTGQYGNPSQPDPLTADDIMFGIVLRE